MLFMRVDVFLDELTEVVMVNHFAAMVLVGERKVRLNHSCCK